MMGSVSLAVVGGSLVAWQVYSLTSNYAASKGITTTAAQPNNQQHQHSLLEQKEKLMKNQWLSVQYSDEPEYIRLKPHHHQRHFMTDPASDCVKAKGELRSMLKRRQWKLLKAANNDLDLQGHQAAVAELAGLAKHLSDGDMRQLAQASSLRTAVGLANARAGAHPPPIDPRFFLTPPPLPETVEKSHLPNLFRVVLTTLPTDGIHECIRLFTTTALENYVEKGDAEAVADVDLDAEFSRDTHHVYAIPRQHYFTGNGNDSAFLEYCLQALLSHSTLESHCELMVHRTPMLPLLIRIIRDHPDNARIKSLIGKIVANMAMFTSTHTSLFRSGFVSILSQWRQDPNLLVTLPASRALANLDQDFAGSAASGGNGPRYGPGVYPMLSQLHKNRLNNNNKTGSHATGVDVVFLHGLLGGVFYTWRQADPGNTRGWGTSDLVSSQDYSYCWPRDWFKEDQMDQRGVRVIGVDFDTYLSQWGNSCPKESFKNTSLQERSSDIYAKLRGCGVGDRPVVFVGHSMGGLIIKQMLMEAVASEDAEFVENTRGIVFYSTPHNGSEIANLNKPSKWLFSPSTEVQDLAPNSPALGLLHQNFLELVDSLKVKVISFGEAVKTPYLGLDMTMVSGESANPNCGEHITVPENHMNVCKPGGKSSILYRKLVNLVWDELDQLDGKENGNANLTAGLLPSAQKTR